MYDQNSILFRIFSLTALTLFCFGLTALAQDTKGDDDATVEEAPVVVVKRAEPVPYNQTENDANVPGATVRGRLVYEDTNRPLRYAMITLVSDKDSYSAYSTKFVKTDANGEFLFKNVKPGTYQAFVKSEGVLNPESYKFSYRQMTREEKEALKTEKIEIAGLGEFQIMVAARRGAAISGRIFYADGEAAVGVKVEILRREGAVYSNSSSAYGSESGVGTTVTDDRGFYRVAGLPEGQYIVRVVEPASHTEGEAQSTVYSYRSPQNSLFKTYYPEGETSKDAKTLELIPGQEQPDINISLPERRLYGISGRIAKKGSGDPLANFRIVFNKLSDRDAQVAEGFAGVSTDSNKAGEWKLTNLPPGKYRITISQGYSYDSDRQKDAAKKTEKYPNMSKEIEISDKNLADLNFEVPAEAAINGTIIVEGGGFVPPGVRLYALFDRAAGEGFTGFDYEQFQPTSPSGAKEMTFRIGKLSGGNYRLVSFENQKYYLKSVTLGSRDLLNSPLEVREGEELQGVRVVLAANMGTIKGKVAGYDGKETVFVGAIGAGAVFAPFQARTFTARVSPSGEFEIKAAPGEYSLVVLTMKNRPATEAETKEWFEKMVREGTKITVTDSEPVNVSLSLPK